MLKEVFPRPLRRWVKVSRARALEAVGSDRYSRPSLNHLDRKLEPYLAGKSGVFLEIGANDGYSQSNTYFLERWCGWRGILIEANPSLIAHCAALRPASQCYSLACTSTGRGFVSLAIPGGETLMGQVDIDHSLQRRAGKVERPLSGFRVPAVRVSDVIDDANESKIDFMSVDVEGAEFEVLAGLDLTRHTPRFLLVETASPDRLQSVLRGHMELIGALTHHDYLYRRIDGAT